MQGTIAMPGILGGGNWGGAAFDPGSGTLFVKSSEDPSLLTIGPGNPETMVGNYGLERGAPRTLRIGSVPITNPPWGTLTAIDMNAGEILWQEAVGERPEVRSDPALAGVALPARLGVVGPPGPFVTGGGLVFLTGGSDILYAFDAASGEVVVGGPPPGARLRQPHDLPHARRAPAGRHRCGRSRGRLADRVRVAGVGDRWSPRFGFRGRLSASPAPTREVARRCSRFARMSLVAHRCRGPSRPPPSRSCFRSLAEAGTLRPGRTSPPSMSPPSAMLLVGVGDGASFSAIARDAGGMIVSGTPQWSIDNTAVATIDQNGFTTSVATGLATVTATIGGVSGTAGLEVFVPRRILEYAPGQHYYGRKDYVEYIPGELPVVLSSTHGGALTPGEIPNRTFGVVRNDRNSLELTLAMRQALLDLTGQAPHVILSHLHRSKLDANREIVEAAQENPYAELAWTEFQEWVRVARAAVAGTFGKGLYFDIHGHGHDIERARAGIPPLLRRAQPRRHRTQFTGSRGAHEHSRPRPHIAHPLFAAAARAHLSRGPVRR